MKNKKKVVIIVSLIVVAILMAIVYLYNTFASSSSISKSSNNVYDVTLSDSNSVTVPAYGSKTVYYKVYNDNKGTVSYGVGYTNYNNGILVKELYDTLDYATDTIDYRGTKYIKLKIINRSAKAQSTTLSTVLGYVNGGDLTAIAPDGVSMVKDKAEQFATMKEETGTGAYNKTFIDSGTIVRDNFKSLTFVADNEVPSGATSFDLSVNGDKSVMLWYESANSNGKYDVFIGYNADKLKLTSGYHLFSGLRNLSSLDVSCLDTSDVTDMTQMFDSVGYNASSFKITGLDAFDTSNVTNMSTLFRSVGYSATTFSLDGLGGWNTSNVTNMTQMFLNAGYRATDWSLNLSKWDVGKVTKHTNFGDATKVRPPTWVN